MIQSVMNSGFKALSAWLLFFSAVVLLFFIAASVVNAISGSSYIGSRGRNAVQGRACCIARRLPLAQHGLAVVGDVSHLLAHLVDAVLDYFLV